MGKAEIEHINNIVKVASAKGTDSEPAIEEGIENLLSEGVARIQSKMIMYEAFKIESINDAPFLDKVSKRYDTLCREYGYK